MYWTFNDLTTILERSSSNPIVQGVPPGFIDPTSGHDNNPYAARTLIKEKERDCDTVCLAKVDGFIFGIFLNSGFPMGYLHSIPKEGKTNHAEDGFVAAFEQFAKTTDFTALQAVHVALGTQMGVTLKLNKTPCESCVPMLIDFKKKYKLSLRIKAMKQYYPGQVDPQRATQQLVQADIPVIPFNVPQKVKEKGELYRKPNRFGQAHELATVRFDEKELLAAYKLPELQNDVKVAKQELTEFELKVQEASSELAKWMQAYRNAFDVQANHLQGVVVSALRELEVQKSQGEADKDKKAEARWECMSKQTQKFQTYRLKSGAEEETKLLKAMYRQEKRVTQRDHELMSNFISKLREKLKNKSGKVELDKDTSEKPAKKQKSEEFKIVINNPNSNNNNMS